MDEALKWGVLLACLAAFGCSTRTSVSSVGPTVPLASSDSIRFVQVEKETPYCLLWPSKNIVNLWVRVSATRTCALYPYPYARREYVVVLRGHQSLGVWTDDSAYSPDSGFVAASFTLTESAPDTLSGLAVTRVRDDCGMVSDTLTLRLARTLP